MACQLSANSYGKSRVRVTKVTRLPDRHELKELSVDVSLEGAFEVCYTCGDNAPVVATDSMKNTVYVLARQHPIDSIESFALHLGEHFLRTYDHVSSAKVEISQTRWDRISVNGQSHRHAFVGGGSERRVATARLARNGQDVTRRVTSGVEDLLVLKTTDSAFAGHIKDKFTTLKDTDDRIFATVVSAAWEYAAKSLGTADYNAWFDCVRGVILEVFATHKSLAVQQTLYEMGGRALDALPNLEEISISMPNQHRLLVDLTPFGLDNKNEIFVPTSEPYGLIKGTMRREC